MNIIERHDFVELYILPNETKEIILKYYDGSTDFDNDYLIEVALDNGLIIKDINE
tara:strand:- start:430 stop:594 length:165 start_codon:yes stop_codon:yes gene_type:complete